MANPCGHGTNPGDAGHVAEAAVKMGHTDEIERLKHRALRGAVKALDAALALSEIDGAGDLTRMTMEQIQREAVIQHLGAASGKQARASETLGIPVRTLRDVMKRFGLRPGRVADRCPDA